MAASRRPLAAIVGLAAGLSLCATTAPAEEPAPAEAPARVDRGLRVLYTFDAGRGDQIQDRSGAGRPLHLKIENPSAVRWESGRLVVQSSARIRSPQPARKITAAVKRSGELTLEAWLKPQSDRQSGPARIVTISANTNQRNVTLGQDNQRYDVRLRTASTSGNGLPSTATSEGSAQTKLTHVVYARDASGTARIFINGKQQAKKKIAGKLTAWDDDFRVALANEVSGDRPWLGELHLVAIYTRALHSQEVLQNFKAGIRVDTTLLAEAPHAKLFETKIAPLLAQNCLECHDTANRKGELDLSQKSAALTGGDSGPAIVPGQADASLLWDLIDADEMPPEGDPLSDEQKTLVRQWIDSGATWSLEKIDPAIYAHDETVTQNWLRRLTRDEYVETVRSAVGVDITEEAQQLLPPDIRADGFSNTAYNLNVDFKHVEAYARLAEIIVGRMDVPKFVARFTKSRSLSTDDTMRDFVAEMGKWLLRGPLDDREVTNYSGIATTVASAGGDFDEASRLLIESMLQSPRFVYRIERQRGDGTRWPVDAFELASRMSYILWGGPPDEELLRAADAGELYDREQVASQVDRMLRDPRAVERSRRFIGEWLNLDRLGNLQPDTKRFPAWDPALAADMREETLAYFEEIAWERDRPLADLLNAQLTFATPRLAKFYGLQPAGSGLKRYDVSNVPSRGGLLTHGSVLTIGGDDASMVTRGLFVLHDLLRGVVKDPPPGIDTRPVPSKPGLSQRNVAETRIANQACGGCHVRFEPLAFGLEKFDGLGAFRERDEHGNQLREDGEILIPGAAEPVKYQTAAQLMDLLAGSERVRETITWKLAQFALGRPLTAGDAPIVETVHKSAQQDGGTYKSLIRAIVTSDLVMTTRTESP